MRPLRFSSPGPPLLVMSHDVGEQEPSDSAPSSLTWKKATSEDLKDFLQ